MALHNINLEFQKGEFVAITGMSGSGKSTLLNVISGMDSYEEGEMYVQGEETSYYDAQDWETYRREKISFIYQSYNLIDSYTALENVETVMEICDGDDSKKAKKQHREKAKELLEQVGLGKWGGHKAVHLSSGQKQRLGIARALAKDTEIIIADEPTGNLDIENGEAVMKMLYELSKDRLVIVVTHNFDQVDQYATRKIRLFDGEIAEDLQWKKREDASPVPAEEKQDENKQTETGAASEKKTAKGTLRKAVSFVRKNRRAQPHRTFFIGSIMAVSIVTFFIMFGYFLGSIDDYKARTIQKNSFENTADNRLIVRKADGSAFTDEDMKKIQAVKYVSYADKYDYVNDISCLFRKNEDYMMTYQKSETSDRKSVSVAAKDYSHYMKAAESLTQSDLLKGKLPENAGEVVLPKGNEDLEGKEITIYFREESWSDSICIGSTFLVTGIADREEGPFFTEEFRKRLNVYYGDRQTELNYQIQKTNVPDDETAETTVEFSDRKVRTIFVEGEGLKSNQIRISQDLTMNLKTEGKKTVNKTQYEEIVENANITEVLDHVTDPIEVTITEGTHEGSSGVAECSRELLEELYGSLEIVQISVFIEDYAYTGRVLKAINHKGYQAVSAMRISAGDYEPDKLRESITSALMTASFIVVIFILSALVLYAMMKLRRKDFGILKSLGMKQRTMNEMNYYELVTGSLFLSLACCIVGVISRESGFSPIGNFVRYYTFFDYVLVVILSVLLGICAAWMFNRHLSKLMNAGIAKEEG